MKIIIHIIYCLILFLSACSLISTHSKNIVINNSDIDNQPITDTNRYIIPKGNFLSYFNHDTLIIDYSDSILEDWEGGFLEEEITTDTFKIVPQRISKRMELVFFHFNGVPNSKAKHQSEYIKYYDQTFEINELFANNVACYKVENPLYLFVYSPDYFTFK